MSCECQRCQDSLRWQNAIYHGTHQEKMEAFREMWDAIENAETDAAYLNALLDGTWPTGKEVLEFALRKYNV